MSNRPHTPAKDVVGDYETFINFTRRVLSVPHSAIKAKLDQEKVEKRTRQPKRRSASRASVSSSTRASR